MKLAWFEGDSIKGWYHVREEEDPHGIPYANLPPAESLVQVSDEIWDDPDRCDASKFFVDQTDSQPVVKKKSG